MFTLDLPTEPRWLDLPHGVRVLVRPLDAAVQAAAQAYAERICREMLVAQSDAMAAGAALEGFDLSDTDMRTGTIAQLLAIGLARFGIIAWDGVGDENGNPLEMTQASLEAFGRSPLSADFVRAYDAPRRRQVAEGNASAPGPNGPSDQGATTVPVARPSAPPAQVH